MPSPSSATRDLARRLLSASRNGSGADVHHAAVVTERLRALLTSLVGVEGCASLLRRALTLAGEEVPSLRSVEVCKDGRFEECASIAAAVRPAEASPRDEAAVAVAAHLLWLLITFIGEGVTMRLVRQTWPDAALDDYGPTSEGDG